jgi:hypothetical protein
MALKYESGEVRLSGSNRPSTYETVFIPLRPGTWRMSQMAFSALSIFFVIIVPLQSYDEPNVSLIQTAPNVQLPLTGYRPALMPINTLASRLAFSFSASILKN